MEKLKIEYIAIDKITPYENNARKHSEPDVAAIKNSIEQFGMNDPIAVWGEKNIIVEGHGRLMAMQELGETEAPCIRLDRLTDEERRAYALAHNKTAELSTWDFEKLEKELAELSDIDMSMVGFDIDVHDEVNIDDFFTESEPKAKEPKTMKCPHCGEIFEV